MYERESITDRVNDLMGVVIQGAELLLANRADKLARKDPELAARMRRRLGPGFKVVARYDAPFVDERLDYLDKVHGESREAFARAVEASHAMIRNLAASQVQNSNVVIDCRTLASHQRAIHGEVLLFHLRAAQALSVIQEIEGSITLLHKCEPDPCAPLPPDEPEGYTDDDEESEQVDAQQDGTGDATPTKARRRGRSRRRASSA